MMRAVITLLILCAVSCTQRTPRTESGAQCENLKRAGQEMGQRFYDDDDGASCFLAGFDEGRKTPVVPVAMNVPDRPLARVADRSGPNPINSVNARTPAGLRFRIKYKALSMTPSGPRAFDGGEETLRYEEASTCWKRALEMMMRDKKPHIDVDCSSEDAYGVKSGERLRFELSCIEVSK